jgi:nickel-type superoxide dismutase maturation protease
MVREWLHLTHPTGIAILGGAGLVAAAGLAASRLSRIEVTGDSMAPTLLAGDRLLVLRGAPPTVGAIVTLADPRHPERTLVKRVALVDAHGVHVRGDHPQRSTDSRDFGPVAPAALLGRAVYRYAPAERAAWLSKLTADQPGDYAGRIQFRR